MNGIPLYAATHLGGKQGRAKDGAATPLPTRAPQTPHRRPTLQSHLRGHQGYCQASPPLLWQPPPPLLLLQRFPAVFQGPPWEDPGPWTPHPLEEGGRRARGIRQQQAAAALQTAPQTARTRPASGATAAPPPARDQTAFSEPRCALVLTLESGDLRYTSRHLQTTIWFMLTAPPPWLTRPASGATAAPPPVQGLPEVEDTHRRRVLQ